MPIKKETGEYPTRRRGEESTGEVVINIEELDGEDDEDEQKIHSSVYPTAKTSIRAASVLGTFLLGAAQLSRAIPNAPESDQPTNPDQSGWSPLGGLFDEFRGVSSVLGAIPDDGQEYQHPEGGVTQITGYDEVMLAEAGHLSVAKSVIDLLAKREDNVYPIILSSVNPKIDQGGNDFFTIKENISKLIKENYVAGKKVRIFVEYHGGNLEEQGHEIILPNNEKVLSHKFIEYLQIENLGLELKDNDVEFVLLSCRSGSAKAPHRWTQLTVANQDLQISGLDRDELTRYGKKIFDRASLATYPLFQDIIYYKDGKPITLSQNIDLKIAAAQENPAQYFIQTRNQYLQTLGFEALTAQEQGVFIDRTLGVILDNYPKFQNSLEQAELDKMINHLIQDLDPKSAPHSLIIAGERGFTWFVKKIIESVEAFDFDIPTDRGRTILYIAVEEGYKDLVELLLDNHADPNIKENGGWTPIHLAALSGDQDIVEMLLEHGVDLNIKDNGGKTPLHLAVVRNNQVIVDMLLEHGVDLNIKENGGKTPLRIAIMNGCADTLKLIFESGKVSGDFNTDINGLTPLNIAVIHGYKDVVKLILKFGEEHDLNKQDRFSENNCLHIASEMGNYDIVKLIVESGKIDPFAEIKPTWWGLVRGYTPRDLAVKKGHTEIAKLLEQYEIQRKATPSAKFEPKVSEKVQGVSTEKEV